MARWSLGELIVGRDLQFRYWKYPQRRPTEAQLATFTRCFGTSARRAYAYAANPQTFVDKVHEKIDTLNAQAMVELVRRVLARTVDDEISHDILVATPSPDDRQVFTLQISTEHLWKKVLGRLDHTTEQAADMLYQLFIDNPRTRASAGYLLERAFPVEFPNGGEWPMTAMKKSPQSGKTSTHWRSDDTKPSQYLRLGYQGHIVAIANDQIEAPVEAFDRLDCHRFSCGEALKLKDRFYIPHSRSQPSFDAFVYEAGPQRATIFQVTVSSQHPISTEGLDSLHGCGAKSFRLVVVTPPL
ncbi:hypothetical protein WOLCODRAFT_141120, partial [Wolfiporia cocos MD-104 SS10]